MIVAARAESGPSVKHVTVLIRGSRGVLVAEIVEDAVSVSMSDGTCLEIQRANGTRRVYLLHSVVRFDVSDVAGR